MSVDAGLVGADSANLLSSLFVSIDQHDRQALAGLFASMQVQRVRAGDELFRPGKSCERFAVVIEGEVAVSLISGTREKVLYAVVPGQLCVHTLTNLLNDQSYQARAVAQVETRIGWMDVGRFRQAYQTLPALQRVVVAALSERCFQFVREIHDLCFRSIPARLADVLLEIGDHDHRVIHSHQSLAHRIGSSREVVSRQLKRWETMGVCRLHRGAIEILDHRALLELASDSM